MKRLIVVLCSFLSVMTLSAQSNICLHMKDGSKILKYISDVDSITFDATFADLVRVSAGDAYQVHANTAKVYVSALGETSMIEAIGVCYSTSPNNVNVENGTLITSTTNVASSEFLLSNLPVETTIYYKGFIKSGNSYVFSELKNFTTYKDNYPVAEAVDLGLSVKWSSWSMGAFSSTEYGGYYGWGDPTGELNSYNNKDYAVGNTSSNIAGTQYDIAHVKWGGKWRMPTRSEIDELSNLEWKYEYNYKGSGANGWVITAKNGNSIFVPSAGYEFNGSSYEKGSGAYMWTSETNSNLRYAYFAKFVGIQTPAYNASSLETHNIIRPVYDPNMGEEPKPLDEKEVDLGLSVNWASYNIGASNPGDYGDYYAWGEIETKDIYSISNYKYYGQALGNEDDIQDTEYDVAKVKWGDEWMMPSKANMLELVTECSWTWTSYEVKDNTGNLQRTVNGYKITGPNGNSIFLPAAGFKYDNKSAEVGTCGNYFSSYMYVPREDNLFAYTFFFDESLKPNDNLSFKTRSYGLPVRPVRKKSK